MPKLIKSGQVSPDAWVLVRDADAAIPHEPAIVPLAPWLVRSMAAGRPLGVWLAPDQDPAVLAPYLAELGVVAVDFPQFADGRGYSIARLLRERYGYQGELRAIGDIQRDQLYFLQQVGFDAFALPAGCQPEQEMAGLKDFSAGYQTSFLRKNPLFRSQREGITS